MDTNRRLHNTRSTVPLPTITKAKAGNDPIPKKPTTKRTAVLHPDQVHTVQTIIHHSPDQRHCSPSYMAPKIICDKSKAQPIHSTIHTHTRKHTRAAFNIQPALSTITTTTSGHHTCQQYTTQQPQIKKGKHTPKHLPHTHQSSTQPWTQLKWTKQHSTSATNP